MIEFTCIDYTRTAPVDTVAFIDPMDVIGVKAHGEGNSEIMLRGGHGLYVRESPEDVLNRIFAARAERDPLNPLADGKRVLG